MTGKSEASIKSHLILALSKDPAVRIFNQPVGIGYQGVVEERTAARLILRFPRVITFGLCKDSSDLIGWKTVIVTADMIGRRVAVFTAIETKTKQGHATKGQENFIDRVNLDGGFGRIARSAEEDLKLSFQKQTLRGKL